MKIVHVVWGMKLGGVETMLVNIINEQVKTDEVCLIIINDFVEQSLIEKISPACKIKYLNRTPGNKNPLKILKLNIWILKIRPDIIHVHSYKVSKLIVGKWNIVRTVHNTTNVPEEYPRMKKLFAISDSVAEEVKRQGFKDVVTIPNGILVTAIKNQRDVLPANGLYKIVQVGRLNLNQKGQDLLVSAVKKLFDRGVDNFKVFFVGAGDDEEKLKTQISNAGMTEYFEFEGLKSQDYIYEHLCDYDLSVQPSRYEGFGITVAEALAAKVPVLVTNIEGPMEIIDGGQYGLSFKSEDVEDLASKLETVLSGGYDYTLIEKAYQHVCNTYNVKLTAQRYLQEYHKIVG